MNKLNGLDERVFFFIMRFFNRCYGFKVTETIYADNYTKQTFKNKDFELTYALHANKLLLIALSINGRILAIKECSSITDIMDIFDTFDKIIRKEEN